MREEECMIFERRRVHDISQQLTNKKIINKFMGNKDYSRNSSLKKLFPNFRGEDW